MSFLKRLNVHAKTQDDTGFGTNASNYGGRFIKKDGRANIIQKGVSFFEGISWYHRLLVMPGWKFLVVVLIFYIVINLFFACVYYIIGPAHLTGMHGESFIEQFGESFFFSAQTFTTVGYGRVNPVGFVASAVAAFEALLGMLSLALAAGLLYGRFSKPTAYLKFSKNAVLANFKEGIALMFRVAPYKNTILSDAEIKISVAINIEENGKTITSFFPLDLEVERINSLALNWTIVHSINEKSPFYKFNQADFKSIQGEILVFIKAFDDIFSNTVISRTSYQMKEIIVGAKFVPMYYASTKNNSTVLDLTKIDEYIVEEITFP